MRATTISGCLVFVFMAATNVCRADNSIALDSVATAPGDMIFVGIHLSNDIPIIGLELPLEIRPSQLQLGPQGRWAVEIHRRGRVALSPLGGAFSGWSPAVETMARYVAPSATNSCSGPVSMTYDSAVAISG